MPLFQKITKTIEAVRYTGSNQAEVTTFGGSHVHVLDNPRHKHEHPAVEVHTPSGALLVHVGDWIAKANDHDFYPISAAEFPTLYKPLEAERTTGLDFGDAIDALKAGKRVARTGWNGKGMWLALSPGTADLPAEKFWAGPNREYAESQGGTAGVLPCITMKTADGKILMGWLASQTDMLASDWEVVTN